MISLSQNCEVISTSTPAAELRDLQKNCHVTYDLACYCVRFVLH